jgi:hypothetical protein
MLADTVEKLSMSLRVGLAAEFVPHRLCWHRPLPKEVPHDCHGAKLEKAGVLMLT